VLADPGEQREDLGVGQVAPALCDLEHLLEDLAGAALGAGDAARASRDLGAGRGFGGLFVLAVFVVLGRGKRGLAVGRGRLCAHVVGVKLEGAVERLDAAQQALLEVDEDELAALAPAGAHERGVLGEERGQAQLRGLSLPEVDPLGGESGRLAGLDVPGAGVVGQVERDEAAHRVAFDAELAQVRLEAPDHDLVQLAALDLDAAGEALGVEEVQQGREAVGVAVVGRGGEEEPVLEAGGHVADDAGDPRVHRVEAGARRGRRVRLVEDEQALARHPLPAQALQERIAVLGAAQELVGDDEAVVGGPRVDREAALLAAAGHEGAVIDLEAKPETALHLVAPLEAQRGRADDEHEFDLLAQGQLLEDEAGFDGLAQAHVVGDEQVRPGEVERSLEWCELVADELDAGAERGLEEAGVGGRDRVPAQGVQVGGKGARRIEPALGVGPVQLGLQDARAELDLPEHLQPPALVVVVEPGEDDTAGLVRLPGREDLLHQVLPVPDVDDVAGLRPRAADRCGRKGRRRGLGTRGFEEPGHEGGAGPAGVVEAMSAARGAQLVAAERAQQPGQGEGGRRSQGVEQGILGSARRNGGAELPPHRGEARPGKGFENAARTGPGHGGNPNPIKVRDYAPTLNSTPWASGSSVPQLSVQVWRRM
jgi:hypothetical protein